MQWNWHFSAALCGYSFARSAVKKSGYELSKSHSLEWRYALFARVVQQAITECRRSEFRMSNFELRISNGCCQSKIGIMHSILIIGGGISGLTSAKRLLDLGHQVTILEADQRLGGRIHTVRGKFSQPVEMGAEFIHGKQPLTFALMKEARCNSVLRKGNHYTIINDDIDKGDLVDEEWNALMRELNKLQEDTDLANFLETRFGSPEYEGLRERVRRFAEGFDIADVDRVSAIALRNEWSNNDEEHQYHVAGGYQKLIHYLEKKLLVMGGTIHTGSKVEEIRWRKGKVAAVLENGSTHDAEKIIITVSLGILKKGGIRFDPPIPEQEEAFRNIGFGGVIKFLFEFKESFWQNPSPETYGGQALSCRALKNLSFVFSDASVPTWWTQRPDEFPLLTGWLGGPASFAARKDIDALYKNAEHSLCYILKCSPALLRSQLNHWHIVNWTEESNHCGAYSYPMVRTPEARKFLLTPIEDTLYFAGEGIHDGESSGTVEAALASGMRVAEMIRQIGSQNTNFRPLASTK
jgi:monoamine oxidase